jgi:hydrogenase maturation protease
MSEALPTLVLGLGNPLMGDDGLGLAALERLERAWLLPPEVRAMDGGTLGLALLPLLEAAAAVLVLDAIDGGLPPGDLVVLERNALPRWLAQGTSVHEDGLAQVLALSDFRGTLPARLVAMGLQPGRLAVVAGLSEDVERGLDRLAGAAAERLAAWGHRLTRRPAGPADALEPRSLDCGYSCTPHERMIR